MPDSELKALKKDIKVHRKKSQFIPDSTFKPDGSAHDTFIAMVKYALFKKSKWNFNYSASFLIKKGFNWLIGLTLEKHQYFGVCYKHRNRKLVKIINKFWVTHWKWLIGLTVPTILTMIGLYVAWLSLIKTKP